MMALDEGSGDHQSYNNWSSGEQFHGNPSNSCREISLKTNLMVALEEKPEDH